MLKEKINGLIDKIGKKRIEQWIFLSCVALSFDGLLQFFVFWLQGTWIKSTAYWVNEGSGFNGIGSFMNYLI
jgi:hypothetical protein